MIDLPTGHKLGAMKRLAGRIGVAVEEFISRLAAGEKYCWRCRAMHARSEFREDASRADGLDPACAKSRNKDSRTRYVQRPIAPRKGVFLVPTRDGDKKQARHRVNHLVENGTIPSPNDLPCVDCGDMQGFESARHEYDHAKGYDGENQLYVEPVCTRCHNNREEARRG